MKKKSYKGRTEKRVLSKCKEVCRFYSIIQSKYADQLLERDYVVEFKVNVLLDAHDYTTDFLITKADGDLMVRECVERKMLTKPPQISFETAT